MKNERLASTLPLAAYSSHCADRAAKEWMGENAECFIFQIHGSVRYSPLSQKTPETKATEYKTQMRWRWEVNITLMEKTN
jgi:hypothetical protein